MYKRQYTDFGNVLTHTNISGDITTYTYDDFGNLETTTLPAVSGVTLSSTNTYFDNGLLKTSTGFDGVKTEFAYDDIHGNNITRTVDPDGENIVHTYGYNAIGDVASYTDPELGVTIYDEYDGSRRLTKQTSPTGEVVEYQYNDNGLLILQRQQTEDIDLYPSGWAITTYSYNRDSLVYEQVDPQENTSKFEYDLMGNLIRSEDAVGRKSKIVLDELYRSIKLQQQVDGEFVDQQINTYTVTGQIKSREDGEGNVTTYDYDGHDQLEVVTYPDSTTETYDYYLDGQLKTGTTRENDEISYEYDVLNRLTLKQNSVDEKLVYEYNALGLEKAVKQYIPYDSETSKDITYTYDSVSRVKTVTDNYGRTLSYDYDKLSRRTKLTFPDSTHVDYSYDNSSRMKEVEYSDEVLATYSYNDLSQLTDITFVNGTSTSLSFEKDFDLSQLTHHFNEDVTLGYAFTHNATGQIKTKAFEGEATAWLPSASYIETHTINNLNQSTNVGGDILTYDDNGNLSGYEGLSYQHNSTNQLTEITAEGINGNIQYQYDGLGRRTSKDVYGLRTEYLYDGNEVIAEYDSTGALTKRFIYGSGIDNPIAFFTAGERYIYHTDEIGSVVALSNSDGDIAEQYSYGPFGESYQISLLGNPLRYTARRLDDETGHYYSRARYYEPQWGKFLQADPLGYADGMNLYAYVGHDPINYIDPFGTMAVGGGFSSSTGAVDTSTGLGVQAFTDGVAESIQSSLVDANCGVPCGVGFALTEAVNQVFVQDLASSVDSLAAGDLSSAAGALAKAIFKPLKAGDLVSKSPASRLADKAQSLTGKQRPNTVAVIKHKDGTVTVGRNQGGVQNSTVQNALDNAPANCFVGQCAEINALSRALNKGRSLDGATISVSNVRGLASTSGIHGTPKAPCTTCANVLDQLNVGK